MGSQNAEVRLSALRACSYFIRVVEMQDLMSDTRQLASEFLITLAEAREKAPGMMRKLPDFAQRLFQSMVSFLLDIEDEAEWHSALETHENAGEGELYDVGQDCLDRLAIAIGGKTIM